MPLEAVKAASSEEVWVELAIFIRPNRGEAVVLTQESAANAIEEVMEADLEEDLPYTSKAFTRCPRNTMCGSHVLGKHTTRVNGFVAFSTFVMRAGACLPLHPFFVSELDYFNIALM